MTTHGTMQIVRGARLLDVAGHTSVPADILIDGDTILEIGAPGMPAPDSAAVIDASDCLLMPGLVNAHTHAHGALAKGMVDDRWPLEVFLNSVGPLNAGKTLEDKYLSGLLTAAEMVLKGCTASYDLFVEFPLPTVDGVHAVAQAYQDVGMRAVIAPMMADRTLYQALPGLIDAIPEPHRRRIARIEAAPFEESLAACRGILDGWRFDRERIRPALAPTIPLHCSDAFLVGCRDLAREYNVGLHTHLAETRTQAVLGLEKYGKSLTAHLDGLGLVGPNFSAAHAIWVDQDDISRLADRGASVAHNILSNLRLGSGVASVRRMLERGLAVGIGTDATNTSDTQNMFEAMRLAAYISRIRTLETSRWLVPEEVLAMATEGSARVLGFEGNLGRLDPGYKADMVFLDLSNINFVPLNNPLRQIVNTENGASISAVMIGGRMVVEDGRLTMVDEDKLRRDVESAVERLNGANAENLAFTQGVGSYVETFCSAQSARAEQLLSTMAEFPRS